MKHENADLLMQYAIDAQHSDTPWEWWEFKDGKEWYPCTRNTQPSIMFHVYRRKADAPQFTTEKVCEWVDCHDDTYITCSGLPADEKGNYCPNCGGKVVIKERMCELAGIRFPVPVQDFEELERLDDIFHVFYGHTDIDVSGTRYSQKEHDKWLKEEIDNGLIHSTAAGCEANYLALVAANKQAIEEAK